MENFKINKNQTPLSDADLAKGKDFGKLMKAYKAAKVPFYKTPKLWIGASSILVASVAALLVFNKVKGPDNIERPFIAPPIASANIKCDVCVLDAQKDSTIIYPSGSKVHVPANAFLDKDGKVVNGQVELHYREFKKAEDVFIAGIPMTYDSAGEQFNFETAGMMEISASQNGRALKTNPAALVKVDMLSLNKDDRFNTYYLDTIEKKWKYAAQKNFNPPLKKDSTEPVTADKSAAANEKGNESIKKVKNEIAALEKGKPNLPKKQDKGKPRFSIKVDAKEFPEIAVYKGVKFQVEDSSYKPEKADITWADIELKRLPENKYQITFINAKEKYQVIAIPVFGDQDYAKATAIYNQKFEAYKTALNQKKLDEARLEAQLQAKVKAQDSIIKEGYRENIKHQKEFEDKWAQADLVYRSFKVTDFGYWNSDHPCKLPPGSDMVKLTLVDAKTHLPLEINVCYLVEKERNVLFAYAGDGLSQFRYDKGKENAIWIMTLDNKLAVATYRDFKSVQAHNGKMEVAVTVVDKPLKTSDEVRHYLEL